jgi:hypothetical protein
MADWAYAPQFNASVAAGPPPTFQTVLDDGKVISRVKHSNIPETWSEEYWFTGAEFDTAYAFYLTKGVATSFTKLSWDVYGTAAQERTVRFAGPFEWQRSGQDFFTVTLTFTRHY